MNNYVIKFEEKQAYPLAKQSFINTCGFDISLEKHQRMMKMGDKVRLNMIEEINIKALVSFYNSDCYNDGVIEINNNKITCDYFKQVPSETVEGVYFYVLTAGECYLSNQENIMDSLYADSWGTSYVYAGLVLLKQKFERDIKQRFSNKENLFLSSEFGPGYFGMPVIESRKFFNVLDSEKISVKVNENGLMIPQKTCAGLYLVLNNLEIKSESVCFKCQGNSLGCNYCIINYKGEK